MPKNKICIKFYLIILNSLASLPEVGCAVVLSLLYKILVYIVYIGTTSSGEKPSLPLFLNFLTLLLFFQIKV